MIRAGLCRRPLANRFQAYRLARGKWSRYWALTVVLLAFALQFYRLDARTLHGDELGSVAEAAQLGRNANSMPYFALLALWLNGGRGEFWLRSLSAMASVGAVAVTYPWTRTVSGPRTALLTTLLLATSPFLLVYGQQVRFYGLALLASGLCTLAFIIWRRRSSPRAAVAWAVSGLLALAALLLNGLLLVGQFFASFLLTPRIGSRAKALLTGAVVVLGGAAIALPAVRELSFNAIALYTNAESRYIVSRGLSLSQFAKIPFTFFFFTFGESVYPLTYGFVLPGAILVGVSLVLGLWKMRRNTAAFAFVVMTGLSALVLLYLVFDPLSPPTLQGAAPRYLIFLLPLFYLVLAAGTQGRLSSFLIIPLLLVNAGGLASYWFGDWSYSDDLINWRSVSQWMSKYVTPHTLVLVDGRSQEQASHYFPDSWNIENDWQYRSTEIVPPSGEFARLIVVTYDFRKDMRTSASELLRRIETGYNRVAAWSKYPLFIYVYDRKPPDAPGYSFEPSTGSVTIPVEIYGLEFQDVLLPVETVIDGQPVQFRGAFALPGPREEQAEAITLQRPVSTGHIILLSNMTDPATAGIGEQVATLKVTARDGTVQILPIRFGYETSAWNGDCQPGACVTAYRWLKRFALLGSERYQESWEEFAASIFSSDLRLNPGVIVRSLELERVGSPGTFYVWGIVLAQ